MGPAWVSGHAIDTPTGSAVHISMSSNSCRDPAVREMARRKVPGQVGAVVRTMDRHVRT
jgi:hypothetical protein